MANAQAARPAWLKKRLVTNDAVSGTRTILAETGVNTVCKSSLCPNQNECFSKGRATFLLLGDICTRSCAFCSVRKGKPARADEEDVGRLIDAVKKAGLKHVVLTSVTRDDLKDGGADQFAKAVRALKRAFPEVTVEVLIPDFRGDNKAIEEVIRSGPDIVGHNIETVKRLYSVARRGSKYRRSLKLLKYAKRIKPSQLTKSSIMVGLGETDRDLEGAMKDLKGAGCDILTLGQYLRPLQENLPVKRYVTPAEFDRYRDQAVKIGFKAVLAGPFVRSSYRADEVYSSLKRGQI